MRSRLDAVVELRLREIRAGQTQDFIGLFQFADLAFQCLDPGDLGAGCSGAEAGIAFLLANPAAQGLVSIRTGSATSSHHKIAIASHLKVAIISHSKSATLPRGITASALIPFIPQIMQMDCPGAYRYAYPMNNQWGLCE